jgi:DNA-binding transcriptional ArsR family regulator
MVVAPLVCCARDGDMANGDRLTIAIAAPNALIADRRVSVLVGCGLDLRLFERSTILSVRSLSITGNATSQRGFYGFSSIALEVPRRPPRACKRREQTSITIEASIGNGVREHALTPDRTRSLAMSTIAPLLAEVAQMVGGANILSTLMDGRALTASDLAAVAGVTAQTASSHLAKLVERGLLTVEKRGPRRFYRLATPLVAQMLEGIMTVAVTGPPRFRPPSRIDSEMRRARTCYDHLAGELGVALTDAMIERRYLVLDTDAGELTAAGSDFLANLGVDLISPVRSRRAFCRPCLDWSERRPHLAGKVGAAIAHLGFERDWIRRRRLGRSVEITENGIAAFRDLFGARI